MSTTRKPLPAKHVGEDDQGRRIYLVTLRDGACVEVSADPEGDLAMSPMVEAELALRCATLAAARELWNHVRSSVIWAMVCEHQAGLPEAEQWR